MTNTYKNYGSYPSTEGWAIYSNTLREMSRLQIYHYVNCLRAGERPEECIPEPPPGRTLVEFAAAAWTPFHGHFFRDGSVPGHHQEPGWLEFTAELGILLETGEEIDVLTGKIYDQLVSSRYETFLEHEFGKWEEERPYGPFKIGLGGDYAALHFHNVFMPESPFVHLDELVNCLKLVVAAIDESGEPVTRIGMDSWMCNLKPFQALFPASFTASAVPTTPDNKGGKGWWGQFITKTAKFNSYKAEELKKSRVFQYPRAHAECSYQEFKEHIADL